MRQERYGDGDGPNGQSGSLTNGFTYNGTGDDQFCPGSSGDAATPTQVVTGGLSGSTRRRKT